MKDKWARSVCPFCKDQGFDSVIGNPVPGETVFAFSHTMAADHETLDFATETARPGLSEETKDAISVYLDPATGTPVLETTPFLLRIDDTTRILYIGADVPFDKIGFAFSVLNDQSVTLTANYWKGSWGSLTIADGTETGGKTMAQNGSVYFTPPSDWVASAAATGAPAVSKFWLQIQASGAVKVTTAASAIVLGFTKPGYGLQGQRIIHQMQNTLYRVFATRADKDDGDTEGGGYQNTKGLTGFVFYGDDGETYDIVVVGRVLY